MIILEQLVESYQNLGFRAFITNLGKYNEGELVGEWVSFPIDKDEFEEKLEEIGIGATDEFGSPYEEWFVTDYDLDGGLDWDWQELGEYPSYDDLQHFGELVDSVQDVEAISNICEVNGGNLEDAINGYEEGEYFYYPGISSMTDLGYYIIEEFYDGDIEQLSQDKLEEYFDYEAFGRDLGFDDYEDSDGNLISAGEFFCGDENASDYDIGYACVEDTGFPSNFYGYFDYEAFGNSFSDTFTLTSDGAVEDASR